MNRRDKMYAALAANQEKINRRLSELEQTRAEATDAVAEGTATLDQFALVGGLLVKRGLKRWGPTLTLSRARRHLNLSVGYRLEEAWLHYLPGDVLSHHPGEQLADNLQVQLSEADKLWNCQSSDPDDRAAAALARLTIGPGLGESRRNHFWSGRCEKLAFKKDCVYEKWWNAGLLDVWPELHSILADAFENAGAERIADDHHHVVPYSAFEHLLYEHFADGVGP